MELDKEALEAAARALFPLMAEEVTGRAPMGGYDQALGIDQKWMREASEAAITAYLSALSEKGVRLMPREANDAMWDAGDRLFPALNEIGNGIEEHGEDVLYEVIPGPGKIWEAMFDAHSEPKP